MSAEEIRAAALRAAALTMSEAMKNGSTYASVLKRAQVFAEWISSGELPR